MRIKCKKISPFHWHKILYLGCGLSGEKVATIRKARERTDSTELGLGLSVCVRSLKNKQSRQQWKMTDAAGHPLMCSRLSSWARITKELQDNLTTLVFIWTPCFVFVFIPQNVCLPPSRSLCLPPLSVSETKEPTGFTVSELGDWFQVWMAGTQATCTLMCSRSSSLLWLGDELLAF